MRHVSKLDCKQQKTEATNLLITGKCIVHTHDNKHKYV